jgi:hypothetical protein
MHYKLIDCVYIESEPYTFLATNGTTRRQIIVKSNRAIISDRWESVLMMHGRMKRNRLKFYNQNDKSLLVREIDQYLLLDRLL